MVSFMNRQLCRITVFPKGPQIILEITTVTVTVVPCGGRKTSHHTSTYVVSFTLSGLSGLLSSDI